jgi:hypothetical protein
MRLVENSIQSSVETRARRRSQCLGRPVAERQENEQQCGPAGHDGHERAHRFRANLPGGGQQNRGQNLAPVSDTRSSGSILLDEIANE